MRDESNYLQSFGGIMAPHANVEAFSSPIHTWWALVLSDFTRNCLGLPLMAARFTSLQSQLTKRIMFYLTACIRMVYDQIEHLHCAARRRGERVVCAPVAT